MSRVLVTGATGFVGRACCPALARLGLYVSVAARNPRIAETIPRVDVRPIPGVGPRVDWSGVLRDVSFVVHLAAQGPRRDEAPNGKLAQVYQRVNVDGARKLAQDASAAGVRRLVYVSSAHVHGERSPADEPLREGDAASPVGLYAESKWRAEQALRDVCAPGSGMELVVLRPPLVYGPGVTGRFEAVLRWGAKARLLPLSRVRERRSLLFVGNLADAIARCLTEPAAAGGTFLVRDGKDLSTPEIIRIIAAAMGRNVRLFPAPRPLLDIAAQAIGKRSTREWLAGAFCVDDAKIRRELGWTPPYTVLQGLNATSAWYARDSGRSR